MKLKIVTFPKRHSRNYILKRVEGLCELLPEYQIEQVEHEMYCTLAGDGKPTEFHLRHCILFEHEDHTFKIIEWDDRDNPGKYDSREIVKSPLCKFVLKCQYNKHKTINPKMRPFFYFDKHDPHLLSQDIERLRQKERTGDLYFRGNAHLGRDAVLDGLSAILNEGSDKIVERDVYFEEMASHKLALSLPGLGRACHREFEAFAVGTPVIMPEFRNDYYHQLIPDYHYISVDITEETIQKRPHEAIAKILSRYRAVTSDDMLLGQISRNAAAYYDSYIRYESSLVWFKRLLEL